MQHLDDSDLNNSTDPLGAMHFVTASSLTLEQKRSVYRQIRSLTPNQVAELDKLLTKNLCDETWCRRHKISYANLNREIGNAKLITAYEYFQRPTLT